MITPTLSWLSADQVALAAPLFDDYRQFYKPASETFAQRLKFGLRRYKNKSRNEMFHNLKRMCCLIDHLPLKQQKQGGVSDIPLFRRISGV